MWWPWSTTVTRVPRRLKACDISAPIGPAPKTISEAGKRSSSKSSRLVMTGVRSRPGIGGRAAEEPVAITQQRAVAAAPPSMRTVWSSLKAAAPKRTLAPRPQKRSSESWCWMAPITVRMRSRTRLKSTGGTATAGRP